MRCGADPEIFLLDKEGNLVSAIEKVGGNKHRKQLKAFGVELYAFLRREGWPPGYQILCHNCNLSKGYYGLCPHWKE